MCGIVGYFGNVARDLKAASDCIAHRGPDMQGIKSGVEWKVAFNRLSILDLSDNGMQPFIFDGVHVYLNGEIYNFKELKDEHKNEYQCQSGSDVEIVPFLYRKYGLDFLNKLNGMFAIVIIDEKLNRKLLVRDRFGQKPIFYKFENESLFFASEIKALKHIVDLEPDKTNIAVNFSCWFLPQPLSLYKNVYNVNPGSYVEFCRDNVKEKKWYLPKISVYKQSFRDIEETFLDLYKESIRIRLRSDVPVGIYLSGGLDSTSMARIVKEMTDENFYAFTANIKNKQFFELNNTDVDIPLKFVDDLGIKHYITNLDFEFYNKNIISIIKNYDEIFLNSGVLLFYALSSVANQHGVKVVLSGVGGDELFGGYPWQSYIKHLPKQLVKFFVKKQSVLYYSRIQKILNNNVKLGKIYQLIFAPHLWHPKSLGGPFLPYMNDVNIDVDNILSEISKNYFKYSFNSIKNDFYNQINFANIFTTIGNQNYMVDLGCMAHSVENRSPLLDYKVFEYMMSIPDSKKVEFGQKGLMRKIFETQLPTYVTQAKKSGPTMPLNTWFVDSSIRNKIDFFLNKNLDYVAEYVSYTLYYAIKKSIGVLDSHKSLPLFAVLNFLIWCKINIENVHVGEDTSLLEFID